MSRARQTNGRILILTVNLLKIVLDLLGAFIL